METPYDVIVIGAGVVGSAIARELSRYQLRTAVLEKNLDVCNETSGRNSAVVHGGFAYDIGSKKAQFCVEGNRGMEALAKELDFPFKRCGKVLVGNTEEDLRRLESTMKQGKDNGVEGLELIDEKRLHELVPNVEGRFAMLSKNSGILDPFLFTVALAENAHQNGVEFFFDAPVTAIRRTAGKYRISTKRGEYECRWVVNAAGLGCKTISDLLGIPGYRVIGSKGNYIIYKKKLGSLLSMPVYPVPSNTYMGIHVTPTVDGNVTIGPDAETVTDFADYGVSKKNMDVLFTEASKLWPVLDPRKQIRTFSGILPKWVNENGVIQDFLIEIRDDLAPNAVNLIGIESPGLTAAVPIARYAVGLIQQRETLREKPDFKSRRRGIVRFAGCSDEEKARLIAENPDYGELVCRCEMVTRAEILAAVHNPLGVSTMTGIKYRTRAMMGECQGGFCQMRLEQALEKELGKAETDIRYCRPGSWILSGKVREEG